MNGMIVLIDIEVLQKVCKTHWVVPIQDKNVFEEQEKNVVGEQIPNKVMNNDKATVVWYFILV